MLRNEFKFFVPMLKAAKGSDGRMRLSGIASSTVQDRHGDSMTRSALEDMLDAANRGLTIFLNHSYNVPEDVAGTVERAVLRQGTGDIYDLAFDVVINEANPRAVNAWEAIQNGTQLGLSIGALIPDGGATVDRKTGAYTINHINLLETSIVGVPANPRSWVEYAVKALRKAEATTTTTGYVTTVTNNSSNVATFMFPVQEDIDTDLNPDEELVDKEVDDPTSEAPEAEELVDNLDPELAEDASLTEVVTAPEVQDATVQVDTPYASITVDTGNRGKDPAAASTTSQEAPDEKASEPENESKAESDLPPWLGVPGNPPAQQGAEPSFETAISPVVMASLNQSAALIASLSSELTEARKALLSAENERDEARRERDEMARESTKALAAVDELLKSLSKTPVGRRAAFHEAVGGYEAIKSVYGEDFARLLAKE